MTMPSMAGPSPQTVLNAAATQAEPQQATVGMASPNIQVSGEQEVDLINKLTAAIDYHQQTFQPYLDKSEEWQKMFMVTPRLRINPGRGVPTSLCRSSLRRLCPSMPV